MLTLLKISFRNLLKNTRRSLVTILSIALGYAAVSIFGGFTQYIFDTLEESLINGRGYGHLLVFKKGYLEEGRIDPVEYMIHENEIATIMEVLQNSGLHEIATTQIRLNGLISDGEVSTVFIAAGRVPSEYQQFRLKAKGALSKVENFSGSLLDDDKPYGIAVSEELADKLGFEPGDGAILSAPTVDNFINAIDVEILQTVQAGDEFLKDKLVLAPMTVLQELMQTSSVERINILLKQGVATDEARSQIQSLLDDKSISMDVKTWEEMAPIYTKVKNMFDIIFAFIFFIVFTIAAMSIINTINMAVLERTKEIGTLRAIGANRSKVIQLFASEGVLLGIAGVILGIIITLSSAALVQSSDLTWIPPFSSSRLPLTLELNFPRLVFIGLVFILLALITAIPPVLRALRKGIVTALSHA